MPNAYYAQNYAGIIGLGLHITIDRAFPFPWLHLQVGHIVVQV